MDGNPWGGVTCPRNASRGLGFFFLACGEGQSERFFPIGGTAGFETVKITGW
jgi:hypothetical protein